MCENTHPHYLCSDQWLSTLWFRKRAFPSSFIAPKPSNNHCLVFFIHFFNLTRSMKSIIFRFSVKYEIIRAPLAFHYFLIFFPCFCKWFHRLLLVFKKPSFDSTIQIWIQIFDMGYLQGSIPFDFNEISWWPIQMEVKKHLILII